MDMILCAGLTKRYGATVAVDGLDLSVESGQVFGLLGPNGAGKTTTMRMLLGLITPTSGRAWLNGRRLPDPTGLHRIGSIIEEPAFHPWMTGRRNLRVLALHGPPPPRPDAVDVALERAGLSVVADRKVKAYSQGMRQRLGLAAALLRDPVLLLLDEPANGLDPAGIREFRTLLRSLADDGVTVVLSSHLLSEVEQICDRVAVVHQGRLVEEGAVGELSATRPRVRVEIDEADQHAARRLLDGHPMRTDGPSVLLVDGADGRQVNETLGRGGVWARQIRTEHPGLEDTFLRLTEEGSDAAAPR